MSTPKAAVAQRFLDGFSVGGDPDAAMACLHPQVVIKESGAPLPHAGTFTGLDGIEKLSKLLEDLGLSEFLNSYEVVEAGDVVVSRIDLRMNHSSGRFAETRVVEVYTVDDDGLIREIDVFYKEPQLVADLLA